MLRNPLQRAHGRVRHFGRGRVAVAFALMLLALLGTSLNAQAAPRQPLRPQNTIHIGECAIGTPALASMYVGTTDYLFVAWVGCDSLQSLNVEGSTDGMNWGNCGNFCTKRTLTEQGHYGAGPALANWNDTLYIGWDGTDNQHHLNVGWYNWTSTVQNKHTLSDASTDTPALAAHLVNGSYRLYLAWTGTNSTHSLNYEYTLDGGTFTGKNTLVDTAAGGPGLGDWSSSPAGWQLYIAWTATNSAGTLCIGYIQQGSTTLGNHNCSIQDCRSNPCSPAYAVGDVGLATYGSKLYAGYYGNGDYNGGYCQNNCDSFRVANTYDGYNFGFTLDNQTLTTVGTYGTSVAYQNSSGGVFQGWNMQGMCGANCWMIGLVFA